VPKFLGLLEAQRPAVGEHLNGGNWKLVVEFTEVESGKRSDRPRLAEALEACRLQGAKLIIAKLDRLARNVAFISNLMESKVGRTTFCFSSPCHVTLSCRVAFSFKPVDIRLGRTLSMDSAVIGKLERVTRVKRE
jgi:hypothetical protein